MKPSTESVWHDFHVPIRHFLQKRVSDESLTDDLMQQVFLRVHQGIHSLRETERLTAWVFQIARNTIADHQRRKSPMIGALEGEAAQPNSSLEEKDGIAACLASAVARLPEKYREAVQLAELEGLTQAEVAHRLGISLPGAKSRVQRGREQLKALWLACCEVQFDRFGAPISCECPAQSNSENQADGCAESTSD